MKPKSHKPIDTLKERLVEISYLASISAVLAWDQEVHMPEKGADARASSSARLSAIVHQKFVGIDEDGLLSRLKRKLDRKTLKGTDAIIVAETWRSFERERKLPEAFVRELSETTSKAQHVWAEARKKNDFKMFLPHLRAIVDLKRKEAELVGYSNSPYDALIDAYEPGLTAKDASLIFDDLKNFLIPLLKQISETRVKIDRTRTLGTFPLDRQVAFNKMVAEKMGFDMKSRRLDPSTHPFTTTFHTNDVRITTRYRENDVLYSLVSTIIETGHALC